MADHSARHAADLGLRVGSDWGDVTEPIACPRCGKVLAVRQLGRVVARHAGRIFIGAEILPCPRRGCGGAWRAEPPPIEQRPPESPHGPRAVRFHL